LLLTKDETEAAELAALLDLQNRERQQVEKEICEAAEEQVAQTFDLHGMRQSSSARAIGTRACSALSPRGSLGSITARRS
jgi:single-stranded DNA-specific DHH superfamily exonuclease